MKKCILLFTLFIVMLIAFTAFAEGTVEITSTKTANVRAKPNTDSAVVGRVNPGDVYTYTAVADNGWVKIILPDGTEGYISGKMVEILSGDANPGTQSGNITDPAGLLKVDGASVLTFGMPINDVYSAIGMGTAPSSYDLKRSDSGNTYFMYDRLSAFQKYKLTFSGLSISTETANPVFHFNDNGLVYIGISISADKTTTKQIFDKVNKTLKPLYGKYTQDIISHYENSIQLGSYKQTASGWNANYTWDCGNGATIVLTTRLKENKKDFPKTTGVTISIRSGN